MAEPTSTQDNYCSMSNIKDKCDKSHIYSNCISIVTLIYLCTKQNVN